MTNILPILTVLAVVGFFLVISLVWRFKNVK